MTLGDIRPGHCYWYSFDGIPERRALIDRRCSGTVSDLYWTWDIESGIAIVLSPADFIRLCDDEVTWHELARLGPEHCLAI